MRSFAKTSLIWASLLVLMPTIVASIPIPVLNLAELANTADVIAIGQIVSINQENVETMTINGVPVSMHRMIGEMRLDQALKGNIDKPQVRFEFALSDAPLGYSGVAAGTYRMVFLKRGRSAYTFVSPYYPSVPAAPGIPLRKGSVLENISYQLEAVVQDSGADIAQKREALYALGTLRVLPATDALEHALQEKSTDLQLIALAALLERNNISGMPVAEAVLTKRPPVIPSYLLHNIDYAISEGVRDDRAIPALARLLEVPDTETRRAAASALWHTSSSGAGPALAKALDDPDFEVRYYGVIGLAEIAGQMEWHPNMDVFRAEEAKYLRHWREWARTNYPK
jgi:HEAT repeat protein